jgi:uncharacterized protein (DUF983 family)
MGKLISAINLKCPRCGGGDLYEKDTFPPKKGWFSMKTHCSQCGLKFEKEIGFFYGAMYVSYMLNIALFVTVTVSYYLFLEDIVNWGWYITGYVVLTFFLIRWIYRMSRSIWLMFFVSYEPDKREIIK